MFIELTQDLGDQKRLIMLNMDTIAKFYANSRGGTTLDTKDGKKWLATDKYENVVKKVLLAQLSAK